MPLAQNPLGLFGDSLSIIRVICRPLEQLSKLGLESRTARGTYYVALELELSLYEPRAISIQSRSISGEELQSRRQRKKLVRTRSWSCLRIDHGESSSTSVELPTSHFLGSLKTFHRCSSKISCLLFGNQPIHRILFLHLTLMT